MYEPGHPPIATDTVRHVGDPVAVIVATSKAIAKDAAEQLEIDYEELPVVAALEAASADGAALVWPDAPGNLCFDWEIGDKAATDAAFEQATQVASIDVVNNRLIANAMEPPARQSVNTIAARTSTPCTRPARILTSFGY